MGSGTEFIKKLAGLITENFKMMSIRSWARLEDSWVTSLLFVNSFRSLCLKFVSIKLISRTWIWNCPACLISTKQSKASSLKTKRSKLSHPSLSLSHLGQLEVYQKLHKFKQDLNKQDFPQRNHKICKDSHPNQLTLRIKLNLRSNLIKDPQFYRMSRKNRKDNMMNVWKRVANRKNNRTNNLTNTLKIEHANNWNYFTNKRKKVYKECKNNYTNKFRIQFLSI